MSANPSASSLPRLMLCAGAGALPQIRRDSASAARGTAIHSYLHDAGTGTAKAAIERVPERYRDECARIDLKPLIWLRHSAGLFEPAFAWSPSEDTARLLGCNLARDYSGCTAEEWAGTADVVIVDRALRHARVVDYKTGHLVGARDPVAEHWQFRALSLYAARAYDCDTIEFVRAQLTPEWTWRMDRADFSLLDLDGFAHELRGRRPALRAAQEAVAQGRDPDVSPSAEACQWCECWEACPAKSASVASTLGLASKNGDLKEHLRSLSPVEWGVEWENFQTLEKFMKSTKEIFFERAKREPIPLPNGKVLTEVEKPRRSLDAAVVHRVLGSLYGDELARNALDVDASAAGIKRALSAYALEQGRSVAGVIDEAMDAIERAGGVLVKVGSSVEERAA